MIAHYFRRRCSLLDVEAAMTTNSPKNQRRSPRQARSRATWEAIVEAAAQILERQGPAALNTNAVAERADVSIGTLYQYFPDKHAILAAAARRELGAPLLGARQRALVAALISGLESLTGLGGSASSAPPAAIGSHRAPRQPRRSSLDRKFGDLVDQFVTLFALTPAPILRPIPAPALRPPATIV
jgi:AcrR family transcriptional regulator